MEGSPTEQIKMEHQVPQSAQNTSLSSSGGHDSLNLGNAAQAGGCCGPSSSVAPGTNLTDSPVSSAAAAHQAAQQHAAVAAAAAAAAQAQQEWSNFY